VPIPKAPAVRASRAMGMMACTVRTFAFDD
jgi:hypothetical protein